MVIRWKEKIKMKVKGFIITGAILICLGLGLTAVASTQLDFNEEFNSLYVDPSLEEKKETFGSIAKVVYEGDDESIDIIYQEGENSFTYYEGKNLTYEITYNKDIQELRIKQNHSWNLFNFGFRGKKAVITVNSALETVELSVSAGNVGFKGLSINTGSIEVDAGNLKIEDSTITNLSVDASAGNLRIERSIITDATLDLSAGNLNLQETQFDSVKAKLSAGNLTFTGDVLVYANFNLDAGNLHITLDREASCYQVNGKGEGDSIILYEVSAGNKEINFKE